VQSRCVCEGAGLADTVRQDIDRYVHGFEREGQPGRLVLLRAVLLSPGMWAVVSYRLTHYALTRVRPRPLAVGVATLAFAIQRILHLVTGVEINTRAHIGPGLLIPHRGTIVIGAVRIGRCCNIAQGVTIGRSTLNDAAQADTPTLGDRVWVGPGAVVAGPVHVGDDAAIGANSVPMRDVPARAVVVGIPARPVSDRGSFAQVAYRGMDCDPERKVLPSNDGVAG
jgi:serine O-acetyltransferase